MRNTTYDARLLAAISLHGKKYVHLMNRAVKRETSYLEQLITENVYQKDGDDPAVYHCVSDDTGLDGRNHYGAVIMAAGETKAADHQFYSNAMVEAAIPALGQKWARPKTRSHLGSVLILTYEWDRDPSFLFDQLDRAFPLRHPSESAYGRLKAHLASQYADFVSLTVVYSGNKSCHVHIAFETSLYRREHGHDLCPEAVNTGHRASWDALLPAVEHYLAYPEWRGPKFDGPDKSLATHVGFRRMPNALRTVDKPDHALGLSMGERVPQIVIWEERVQRRSPDVTALFLTPSRFRVPVISRQRSRQTRAPSSARFTMTEEQLLYCGDRLRELMLDTPFEFSHLSIEGDRLVARLRNGPDDQNPSTIIDEDHDAPHVLGKGSGWIDDGPILPLKLGEMVREWCREYDVAQPFDRADVTVARRKLAAALPHWIEGHESFLLRATEGLGKTTAILSSLVMDALTQDRARQPSMLCLQTYEDAADKCEEFNAGLAPGSRHVGIFLPSLVELYGSCAQREGATVHKYEDADAAKLTFRDFISTTQPQVAAAMRNELEAMWSRMNGRTPIFFTQHSVAHLWATNSLTRQMCSPSFFDADFDAHRSKKDTSLNWLIHDEASVDTFVDLYSPDEWRWLNLLSDKSAGAWTGSSGARQRAAYARHYASANEDHAVDQFATARALKAGLDTFEAITVRDAYEYFAHDDDVRQYQCEGEVFHVRPRDWWRDGDRQVAERIVYLTTEAVPGIVAAKACPELVIRQPTYAIGRDRVTVSPMKFSADKVPEMARVDMAAGKLVIANRLERQPGTLSPKAARGVNGLDNTDIVQYAYLSAVPVYKGLQALNTWLERDDLARIAHIDEVQQGFGRNRGPRNAGAEHTLKISRTLYRALLDCDAAMAELRYQIDITMDANARREGRRAGRRAA
ncbi:hypothetical protein GGR39_003398 [Novosphingobium fluoreni]|uniref:Uncharacterized protein n=1 Tax=Novosphingobium fluoreni TaxID=1391222 RepID=A0A7W6G0Z7_9SPHN|nr:hypothetical protein [Novosphingobium fluoreni]MBB3941717.1 hypothetical protein [Novosphingobium fluoreni]